MDMMEQYTSPLDDVLEDSDFSFELPQAVEGEVLVVDDDEDSVVFYTSILKNAGYVVRGMSTPSETLESLRDVPTVLVTDFQMPEMSGLTLAEKVLERDPSIKVILLTGSGDESTAQAALRLGVSDYIRKPPEPLSLIRSVQRAFHERAAKDYHRAMVAWMKDELERRANAIREITVSTLASLAHTLDMRSPHFQGHSRAVAMQAAAIAETLGVTTDEVEKIRTAGLLHDVGMMAVPDTLVQKPDSLTKDELEVIRTHCDRGVEILEPMKHLGTSIRYVHEHHERWDGSGYPVGKKGEEISLGGQIVGVSEAWIGILASRAYRAGRTREQALQMLGEHSGEWFSEPVTEALLAADMGMI